MSELIRTVEIDAEEIIKEVLKDLEMTENEYALAVNGFVPATEKLE